MTENNTHQRHVLLVTHTTKDNSTTSKQQMKKYMYMYTYVYMYTYKNGGRQTYANTKNKQKIVDELTKLITRETKTHNERYDKTTNAINT